MAEKTRPGSSSDVGNDVQGKPNPNTAPGQSTATDWDRDKSKPSGETPGDRNRNPVGGQHNEQNPQLEPSKQP
jgi:hypothetical protein